MACILNPKILFKMKKLILTLGIVAGFAAISNAQEPEQKARSVVFKFTETWCGPCGGWGWDLAEEIIGDIGDKGYYVGVMGSSSPSTMNAMGYSTFESNFTVGGYPTFMVNNTDGGYYLSTVSAIYNPFYSTSPVASPAGKFSIHDSKIYVNAKVKFWENASGDYYLAAYVIEDGVQAAQNGRPESPASHHQLMRGTMNTDISPWGQVLGSGTHAADALYSDIQWDMTIKSGWDASKLSVLLVVYKKEGSKYTVVNAMKAVDASTTGITENTAVAQMEVYPNPSRLSNAQLKVSLNQPQTLSVSVSDINGRIVYQAPATLFTSGVNQIEIPSTNWSAGTYNVTINGENISKTSTLVVQH